MKKVLTVFLMLLLVPLMGAEEMKKPTVHDISVYGEGDGRVIGSIQRPDWGSNVYMGMSDTSGISNPVLKLFSFTTNRPAEIQITAINFDTGNSERFMVRVSPDDERTINLKSLGGKYTHLDFCSMIEFSAALLDKQTGETFGVDIQNLEYKPVESSIAEEITENNSIQKTSGHSLKSSPICLGKWKVFCASPNICGSHQEYGNGKIYGYYESYCNSWMYRLFYKNHFPSSWCEYPTTQSPTGSIWFWFLMGSGANVCPFRAYSNGSGAYYWVIPEGPVEPGKPY